MLSAQDLALSLGGAQVLQGVSVHVAPDELVGLLGPNGAGKSSLLAALAGLLEYRARPDDLLETHLRF